MQNTNIYPTHLEDNLKKIKLAIFDVDGVITDGQLYYSEHGESIKAFNTLDGHGLKMLLNHNIKVAIISGRGSSMLTKRMQDLGITDVYQNIHNKNIVYAELLGKYNLSNEEVAYMGDDIPDYPLLKISGLSACPKNAHFIIKNICNWNMNIYGGNGAVRLLCDAIIYAQYGLNGLIKNTNT